jgi:hypothetical protein
MGMQTIWAPGEVAVLAMEKREHETAMRINIGVGAFLGSGQVGRRFSKVFKMNMKDHTNQCTAEAKQILNKSSAYL